MSIVHSAHWSLARKVNNQVTSETKHCLFLAKRAKKELSHYRTAIILVSIVEITEITLDLDQEQERVIDLLSNIMPRQNT